jgi:hypothetical protein
MMYADLIASRLQTAPVVDVEIETPIDITDIDVVVYEQKAIAGKINAAVAKNTGAAIVITWEGFTTLDKNASRPRLAHRYNVCVWSRPIIDQGAFPADLIIESIVNRMWQWVPGGGHAFGEAEVKDGGIVPDGKFLKIDCEVTIPISH